MKNLLCLLFTVCLFISADAQEKNYKSLIKELNKMLREADEFSWMYGEDFEVVSPYKMQGDTLSVTIRALADGKPVIHKYEAYLPYIKDFVHDVYFVLSFNSEAVKIYELKQNKWILIEERDIFHLGKAKDEESTKWAKKLSVLFNKLFPLENNFRYWE